MNKSKLSPDGKRVLQILQTEYQMSEEAAMRLIKDGGQMFAVAMLTRKRS